MNKPFIQTRANNSCGICGDTSGDCRETSYGFYCHSDIQGLSTVNGYIYRKPSSDGIWGIWAEDDSAFTPEQRESQRQRQANLKALAESNARTLAANALTPEQRDKHYRAILAELGLNAGDRNNLIKRGLTDLQIETHGYKSVQKFQKLTGEYPAGLPGIGRYGNTLNNFNAGYVCPVRNINGLIVGMQVRRRGSGDENRYVWLSNSERCPVGLADGLPLSIFRADSTVLGFAEGTGPKPHIASLNLDVSVIGASGGNWAGSAEQIKEAIETIQPSEFVLYPDAGALSNSNVMLSYQKLNNLLVGLGYTLQVAWWGQRAKDADDIDELSDEQLAKVELVSWEQFEKWASAYSLKQKAEYFRGKRPGDRALIQPRTVVDQRFVEIELPEQGGCILPVSSDVSTGKTHAIGKLKSEFLERYPDGIFDMQGYRNALLRQTAERNGGDHIRDVECQDSRFSSTLLQETPAVLYCLDSLERRLPSLHKALREGRKLFIGMDEADAVLKHIVRGGTLGKRQASIWKQWCELLKAVIDGGGFIGLFEADLPQICIDAIAAISGAQAIYPLENTHQPHAGREVRFHTVLNAFGEPSDNLIARQCHIDVMKAVKGGQRTFLGTDSKALGKQVATAAIEAGFKVLRIDSETGERKEVQSFLANPDAELERHQYDLVIATTSAESGLSISEGYIQRKFLYGSHLEDRALRQFDGRVRGMLPTDAYVRQRAIAQGEDPDSFTPEGVVKAHQKNQFDSAQAADVAGHFGADVMRQATEAQRQTEAQSLEYWQGVYTARKNLSGAFLRANLEAIYERTGHKVTEVVDDSRCLSEESRNAVKQARKAVREQEAEEYTSRPLERSLDWAINTISSHSCKYLEAIEAQKILDNDKWPGLPLDDHDFVIDEIVKRDRKNLNSHTFSWLCNNPKIARLLDLKSWKAHLEQPFIIASGLKRESLKVNILTNIGIFKLAEREDHEYHNGDPLVKAIAQAARDRKELLWRVFRITIKDKYVDSNGRTHHSDIDICNKLLKKIGYASTVNRKVGPRGNQERFYVATSAPHQAEVWAALERKWADALNSGTIDVGELQQPIVTTRIEEKDLIRVVTMEGKPPDLLAQELAFIRQNCQTHADYRTYMQRLPEELAQKLAFALPDDLGRRFYATV